MRATEFIIERRRNPAVNSKQLPLTVIKQYHSTSDMLIDNIHNLFISLTSVDKLGINPNSMYSTPNGIYCYSADYVTDTVMHYLDELPFVGDAPYVNIFKVRNPSSIIVLNTLTMDDLNTYIDKIVAMPEYAKHLNNATGRGARVSTPGGIFWFYTMQVATSFATENKKSTPLVWSTLFRKLGINGCIDTGDGIIHPHEPSQSVFFSLDAIKLLERTLNYTSKSDPVISKILSLRDNKRELKLEAQAALKSYTAVEYAKKVFKGRWPEHNNPNSISAKAEQVIAQDPIAATSYAIEVVKGPWPQGEAAIASRSNTSLMYATFGLLGRFIKGEEAIRNEKTGLHLKQYKKNVINGPFGKGINGIKDNPWLALLYATKINGRFPEGEAAIASDPEYASSYAHLLGGRFPEGESAIFTDPLSAFTYVMRHVNQPYPDAEDIIASDPHFAYEYAKYILFGKFVKGEDTIKEHEKYNKLYTDDIINGPWGKGKDYILNTPDLALVYAKYLKQWQIDISELEGIFTSDPKLAFIYARSLLNDDFTHNEGPISRFKDGESIIATDAEYSYKYAIEILNRKRFVKGEKVIASDPKYAYLYAKNVIKNPWPPGEAAISSDPDYTEMYRRDVSYGYFAKHDKPIIQTPDAVLAYLKSLPLRTRYIAGEKILATTAKSAYTYAMHLDNRFISGEHVIAQDTEYAYLYAKDVIKKEWPAGERAIAKDPEYAFAYALANYKRFILGEPVIMKSSLKDTYLLLFKITEEDI